TRLVADDPAVIRPLVVVPGEADVDGAAQQGEGGALQLPVGVEPDEAVQATGAPAGEHDIRDERGRVVVVEAVADHDLGGAVGPVPAGGDVDRMELVHVVGHAAADFLRLGDEVHRVPVDDRRAGDAVLREDVAAGVRRGDGRDALRRVNEAAVPEDGAGGRIGGTGDVDGVDAVGFPDDGGGVVGGPVDYHPALVNGGRVNLAGGVV